MKEVEIIASAMLERRHRVSAVWIFANWIRPYVTILSYVMPLRVQVAAIADEVEEQMIVQAGRRVLKSGKRPF